MTGREQKPDGAEPLIIQEGGEPTQRDREPADMPQSGKHPNKPKDKQPTKDQRALRNLPWFMQRYVMTAPISPVTGRPMFRDVRDVTLTYKGLSVVVAMPGWYDLDGAEGVHTGDDLKSTMRP